MKTIHEYFKDWEGYVFGPGCAVGEPHIIPALKKFLQVMREGICDCKVLEDSMDHIGVWLFINILRNADIIKYGGFTRFVWLTDSGKALKSYLETIDVDNCNYNDTDEDYIPCSPSHCYCGPNGYEEGRKCNNPFWR